MSDPLMQQQMSHAELIDQAPGADRRRLEGVRDAYRGAQPGGGVDLAMWVSRIVGFVVIVGGIAMSLGMAKPWGGLAATLIALGSLVVGIAILHWGENAPERRRRARLTRRD